MGFQDGKYPRWEERTLHFSDNGQTSLPSLSLVVLKRKQSIYMYYSISISFCTATERRNRVVLHEGGAMRFETGPTRHSIRGLGQYH
jgi:hypothetical protein